MLDNIEGRNEEQRVSGMAKNDIFNSYLFRYSKKKLL